jgi:inosose dehydratase
MERSNRGVSPRRATLSNTARTGSPILDRLAAGPISWGVCEVPGWGLQLPPDRVLSEMRALGIVATEAGPDGYLGYETAQTRELLAKHGLALVGGFLPVVLHDPAQLEASLAKVRRTAALFEALGARVLCSAAVVDDDWSARIELTDARWDHLLDALPLLDQAAAEHGVLHVLHPHWRTVVERDEDVRRVLEGSEVRICLDTGHLTLGGSDPLAIAQEFAHRVAHVHLQDVNAQVSDRLRSGELELITAVQAGLFQPLGAGGVPVDQVVVSLESAGYSGWYVLEQDTAIMDTSPPPGEGPIDDVRRSIEFLHTVAPQSARTEGE